MTAMTALRAVRAVRAMAFLRPSRSGLRRVARRLVILSVIVWSAMIWAAGPHPPPIEVIRVDRLPAGLEVKVPSILVAGSRAVARVHGLDRAIGSVSVDVISAMRTWRLDSPIWRGSATVDLPRDATATAGIVEVVASTRSVRGAATMRVLARSPVGPLIPLAGARSIVADAEHHTLVTAIPVDRFGNAQPDGTPVDLEARHPDGTSVRAVMRVRGLLAAERLLSRTRAGLLTIRVRSVGADGPEVEVAEVPGAPRSVEVAATSSSPRADGRMLVELRTNVLTDRFDNVLVDGSAVRFLGTGPDGAWSSTGFTLRGVASVHLEAPRRRGAVVVYASALGVRSASLVLGFDGDVTALPVRVRVERYDEVPKDVIDGVSDRAYEHVGGVPQGRRRVVATIGPIRTVLGGYVADGTPVSVIVDGVSLAERPTADGVVVVDLGPLRPGALVVATALGYSGTAAVP